MPGGSGERDPSGELPIVPRRARRIVIPLRAHAEPETGTHQTGTHRIARRRLSSPSRAIVLFAVALCVLLNPLAAASPPDPSWIPGLYDAADFDDVVTHIGTLASTCDACATPSLALDALIRPSILPGRQSLVRRGRPTFQGRAPPLA